ncbi:DUF1643 domain-containing protein [Aerococcus viridans]
MKTVRSTIAVEMILNEDKTERYLYKKTWSRKKEPKLVCIITKHPGSLEPNTGDLTTLLVSNEVNEMDQEYDGFILVNLTSKNKQQSKITKADFSKENDQIVIEACSDDSVDKIIVAIGSIVTSNKEVNEKLKELLDHLPNDCKEKVEVLVGKNGPVHPLSPAARSVGGWHLAKLKI